MSNKYTSIEDEETWQKCIEDDNFKVFPCLKGL